MRAVAAGVTDLGREREINEDRFVLLPEFEVFAVADGMGGHQCGEVASRMATAVLASFFRGQSKGGLPQDSQITCQLLQTAVLEANARIHERAMGSTLHRGMGTTIVAAAFSLSKQRIYLAHAGDSRCYRWREGALERLTRDHSLVEEAMRSRPDMSASELSYLPANVITRALGVEPIVDVEVTEHAAALGDVYLLCSDGLHGFASEERIGEIIAGTERLTEACNELVAEANHNGGGDNITVVLVRMEEGEPLGEGAMRSSDASARISASVDAEGDSSERAAFEADDTAEMAALTDPDAVLAALEGADDDD